VGQLVVGRRQGDRGNLSMGSRGRRQGDRGNLSMGSRARASLARTF
jgi:hypothetical protein